MDITPPHGPQFQKRRRLSIRKTKIYLETKFFQIGGFWYFGGQFGCKMAARANQNGRHMVQHVLLPVNIHFHWNLLLFEFLAIYFDFILAAILKILKTKSTILSDYLFLCQVSKGSAVRSEFSIFCTLVTIATAAILNLFNPQKLPHTTVDIPTKFLEVWWKESKFFFKPPFLFPWQLRQSLSNRFRLFWLISFR